MGRVIQMDSPSAENPTAMQLRRKPSSLRVLFLGSFDCLAGINRGNTCRASSNVALVAQNYAFFLGGPRACFVSIGRHN